MDIRLLTCFLQELLSNMSVVIFWPNLCTVVCIMMVMSISDMVLPTM
jgi:hypothetical protein